MTTSGSKKVTITLDVATRKPDKVVDESNKPATEVTQDKIDQIFRSETGFKYVGVILHAESSPGCMYVLIGDRKYMVCL